MFYSIIQSFLVHCFSNEYCRTPWNMLFNTFCKLTKKFHNALSKMNCMTYVCNTELGQCSPVSDRTIGNTLWLKLNPEIIFVTKMHFKIIQNMSSGKWKSLCLSLNVMKQRWSISPNQTCALKELLILMFITRLSWLQGIEHHCQCKMLQLKCYFDYKRMPTKLLLVVTNCCKRNAVK